MFEKLKKIWSKHGFEIVLGLCILIILILALFRIGKKGTWASEYINLPKAGRRPPQESYHNKPDLSGSRALQP